MNRFLQLVKLKIPCLFLISVFIFSVDLPFLNWFIFLPLLFLVKSVQKKWTFITGALYGFFSYFFYLIWLLKFDTADCLLGCLLYFFIWGIEFSFLKIAACTGHNRFYVFSFFIICIFEYLKTKGFAGFSYGLPVYSQFRNILLIQSAEFAGIWFLDYFIVFTSCFAYKIVSDFICSYKDNSSIKKSFSFSFKTNRIVFFIYAFLLACQYLFGFFRIRQLDSSEQKLDSGNYVKICAVQNNSDPWENGIETYSQQIDNLIRLSENALTFDSEINIIVWPETAVIPSIEKNYYSETDPERRSLIERLLKYINSKKAAFVIGNYNSQKDGKDFNSVYFFKPKVNVIPPCGDCYSKIHLVPFSEYFPFHIPGINLFNQEDLWCAGSDYKVFDYNGFKFSTPVCFEDNFGCDLINFRKNGADFFLNLSNDSWANSLRCQLQHQAMAVFRSVENRVSSVRSTASGQTCIIDHCGKIIEECEPFTESFLTGKIAVNNSGLTFYDMTGDLLPLILIIIAILIMAAKSIIIALHKKIR